MIVGLLVLLKGVGTVGLGWAATATLWGSCEGVIVGRAGIISGENRHGQSSLT